MTRRLRLMAIPALVLTLQVAALGNDDAGSTPTLPTNAAFETLKTLEGTWLLTDGEGKPTDQVASVIKVTAGGSVVHETLFPGQPQEMISIYALDGPDLVMTHYCVLGNQPRMKADRDSSAGQIRFRFVGGSNLDPTRDKHMHEATLTIVDTNHIEVNGVGWDNGAPSEEMCCGLKLVRQP